ncbi:MAG: putative toxin-antitoxin system toxin component, PIN family [Chitinophagaceae bacterium]|nr:MAG: putative toxin-antitoxin system toxin component, PIN family [Chitinophagaceae bacterium]
MAKHRLVVDTNLWISFLLGSAPRKWDHVLLSDTNVLLFSQELLEEFVTVAQRPKFRKYFNLADLEALMLALQEKAEFVDVQSEVTACRDPKDNFLLSLCKDGRATHLLTGDQDLLDLLKFGKTRILTIKDYLAS